MAFKKNINIKVIEDVSCSNQFQKKPKSLDEETAKKRANRLGESLRQMLMSESKEEIKKKDAIYAYNFYEKVEETLTSEDGHKFKKFQSILRSFDPQNDKVSDLYHKIEDLLLPNHPDLADIFLTFLLPSEAVEVGKFFEHFIVTNMGTFIQKLNIYFNKQPAQIRKIYNCLGEMAEENDITMEKIKSRLLPLLKGNQYLIDWFLQNFLNERPPKSLTTCDENINLKDIEVNPDCRMFENIPTKDLIEDSSDNQPCQLRYINGRMFYGSRILLPAKLTFTTKNITKNDTVADEVSKGNQTDFGFCVHSISEIAEKRMKSGQLDHSSSCDEEKSDDEENYLKIDESIELCDENTLKMHAVRLNPTLYETSGIFSSYNTTIKDDGRSPPKKYFNRSNQISGIKLVSSKEKGRKSPKKCGPKSPNSSAPFSLKRHSVDSNAISIAKKIRTIIDEGDDKNKKKINKNMNEIKNLMQYTDISLCDEPFCFDSNNSYSSAFKLSESIKKDSKEKQIDLNDFPNDGNNLNYSTKILTNEKEPEVDDAYKYNLEAQNPSKIEEMKLWTRDEDKFILEEVKIGFENEEHLVSRIRNKLRNRSNSEITSRHKFLMDVLSKLQSRN